jgi:hypothetical protein
LYASCLINSLRRQVFGFKAKLAASPWPARIMGYEKMLAAMTAKPEF